MRERARVLVEGLLAILAAPPVLHVRVEAGLQLVAIEREAKLSGEDLAGAGDDFDRGERRVERDALNGGAVAEEEQAGEQARAQSAHGEQPPRGETADAASPPVIRMDYAPMLANFHVMTSVWLPAFTTAGFAASENARLVVLHEATFTAQVATN